MDSKRIEVEFSATENVRCRNALEWEGYVVGKLKAAGIPIKGTLLYGGLESGSLHRLDDPSNFDGYKYVWVPNDKLRGCPISKRITEK